MGAKNEEYTVTTRQNYQINSLQLSIPAISVRVSDETTAAAFKRIILAVCDALQRSDPTQVWKTEAGSVHCHHISGLV